MLPGVEMMACPNMAVAPEVMHHVVRVESSYNPYAIGVVGGRLVRQPKNLAEAVSTAQMLEDKGFNFSLGLAQVNRYNLQKYGLNSYQNAFDKCPNLQAGSKILAECYNRLQDWGKAFSCYYSGNSVTGFRHGYVQKIYASMRRDLPMSPMMVNQPAPIAVIGNPTRRPAVGGTKKPATSAAQARVQKRIISERPSGYLLASAAPAPSVSVSQPLPAQAVLVPSNAAVQLPAIARPALPAQSENVSNRDSAFVF
jgi:type IV secretion system protein VirB1